MKSIIRTLINLFICLLIISSVTNSRNKIRFNHLSTQDGLSSAAVTCILQDDKGFMWFGTQDGLNRFDGYNFKVFKNDPDSDNSLTDNFIFSIYENKNGKLFVETISGKLHEYDPINECFSIVSRDSVNLFECKMNSVLAIYYDQDSIKWTGALSQPSGLKKGNLKNGEVKIFLYEELNKNSISDDRIYAIEKDNSGNLWVGTRDGLNKYDGNKFIRYKHNPNEDNSISDNWIWSIFEDSRGNLWIGTNDGGLNLYDRVSNTFANYTNNPTDPASISDNYIFSVYEDRGGVIWVGTYKGGVSYFHPSTQVFEHHTSDSKTRNSISSNDVTSIYVDRQSNYWIGTKNGGLDRFDNKMNKFRNYSNEPGNSNSLINNYVHKIFQDKSGVLWVGTYAHGLDEFDPKTGIFKHYKNDPGNTNSLSNNSIYDIIEDKDGYIWVGTNAGGLNRYDKKSGKFLSFQYDENDSTSISSNTVWSILEDRSGKLWIGTFGGGLNYFDRENNRFNHFKNNPSDSRSISDNNIIRLFEDSNGNLWIGTTSGLNKFNKSSGSFINYREKDGLANDLVYGILEDESNNLWISTNNGLSKFNPQNESFKNYYYEDGLQSNEFNQNPYAKAENSGKLLFGGPNGLNIFHPDSIKDNEYIPPIAFTNFLRYNTDDEEGKPIIEKGISVRDSVSLTYKDNIVIFDFASLSFKNNFMNQYRYKLEGFNENWIQLGNNRTVTFTNLSPDDYTLKVIGSNNDGLWNEEGASIFIEVSPPWWKTNIAYSFYGLMFIGFLFTARKIDNNRREQKARIRESELRIKATEAEKKVLQIENERKTKELEEARQLQLSMLPKEIPEFEHLEIAAFMRTATEVGGDYYDIIDNEDGTLNIAFGDATGHGLQAGTMVTLMKGLFTSFGANSDIKSFFERSTKTIKEIKLGRILMSFSFIKISGMKMNFSSASMPPIFYYNKSENKVEELQARGLPLGARAKIKLFDLVEKDLTPGDIFMLFSDGIPEQQNSSGEVYDYPRLQDNFLNIIDKEPQDIITSLVNTFDDWCGDVVQEDDITLMVVKVK